MFIRIGSVYINTKQIAMCNLAATLSRWDEGDYKLVSGVEITLTITGTDGDGNITPLSHQWIGDEAVAVRTMLLAYLNQETKYHVDLPIKDA